ncbi:MULTISPECIES: hypothetical protein [unclassified Streptomyces]|uniref:hypothetical protein n=1 Tax=unclassified Streptomyces TaxID=2593676 RepID=UPI0033A545EE
MPPTRRSSDARLNALFDHLLAVTTDARTTPVVERRQALERLAATALPDPLLNAIAARADPRGLGGAEAGSD